MKVHVGLVGFADRTRTVRWPDGWPIPAVGQAVHLSGDTPGALIVRTVAWYPEGDEPLVYIVIGPPSR